MEKYVFNQIINNQLVSKISFFSSEKDYFDFKNFILLPKKDELIKEFYFYKIQLKDKNSFKSYISFATDCSKNENDVYAFLKGRFYTVYVNTITLYFMNKNTTSYFQYLNSIEKGLKYEKFIFSLLEKRGYIILHNCLNLGFSDNGIDFIALKNDAVLFIQCKNYENTEITHTHLKEFYANCELYFLKNSFDGYKKRFLYITSFDFLSDSARFFLKENSFLEHYIISMREKIPH